MRWSAWTALSCCGLALSLDPRQQEQHGVARSSGTPSQDSWNTLTLTMLAEDATHQETSRLPFRRSLATGDFEEFNQLIRDSFLRLPDTVVNEQVAFIPLALNLTNMRCTGLQVGDVVINYNRITAQRFAYSVEIVDLDLTCFVDYVYDYGVLSGQGSVEAYTSQNTASTQLMFSSPNFDQFPPSGSVVDTCTADVEIDNLEFRYVPAL
jgi:hypothetical protein